MKVVILAGGRGSRLSEETPSKSMVEIGTLPILWLIMMYYSHYGLNDFTVALGHKGELIKKFFVDNHSPHIGEPAEPPRIAPARESPAWDDPPVAAVPDWEALAQPRPEHVFDQQQASFFWLTGAVSGRDPDSRAGLP